MSNRLVDHHRTPVQHLVDAAGQPPRVYGHLTPHPLRLPAPRLPEPGVLRGPALVPLPHHTPIQLHPP
ncbi:MAG: hypothetical protein ACLFVP_08080 [Candidatus Bathyarchaeia archaeon]